MMISRVGLACFGLITKKALGFSVVRRTLTVSRTTSPFQLASTEEGDAAVGKKNDDYDDWYADFDPSEFEVYNKNEDGGSRSSSPSSSPPRSSGYRGGGGGGGGASHDYARDNDDQSNVDLATVNALMSERLQYRKTARFDEADAIRDELLDKHGVAIRDKDRTWRSGCSSRGSGGNWQSGNERRGGGDRFGGDRGGGDRGRGDRGRGGFKKKKDFGPNGHDYRLSHNAGPSISSLSEEKINALLAERLECKLNREFRRADAIQEELFSADVSVNDGNKEWRADGQGFDGFTSREYKMSENSLETSDAKEIQEMVDERSRHKAERMFRKADDIRDQLVARYNAIIDDRSLLWSVGGDFGPTGNQKNFGKEYVPFSMSQSSELPDDPAEIQKTIEARDAARADRDFGTADALRDDLLDQNIFINDKLRQWCVGPDNFFDESRRDRPNFDEPHVRRGGGTISEEAVEEIMELLQERDGYKRNRDFGKADRIRDRLMDDFQVRVDDRSREWHVVSDEYTVSANSAPVDPETQSYIEAQITKRALAKLHKDYDTADDIRDEMMNKYSVSIDDRIKEWIKLESDDAPIRSEDTPLSDYLEMDASPDSEAVLDSNPTTDDDDMDESPDSETVLDNNPTTGEEDLTQLTIPELKERLRAAKKTLSGKKAELIERLATDE
jgi:cysteinyl-tRNA synthetase